MNNRHPCSDINCNSVPNVRICLLLLAYIYLFHRYPETAATLSYAALKSTLYRQRMKLRPTLPKDMDTLAANLSMYKPLERFYKGNVICKDGKKALIFTSTELLQELEKSTELYMDGTFNVSSYIL